VSMMHRARLLAALAFAGLGLAACDGGGGGAHYRYDDSLYWNDYYYMYGRPDRPTRPDPPAQAVPPIGTVRKPAPAGCLKAVLTESLPVVCTPRQLAGYSTRLMP